MLDVAALVDAVWSFVVTLVRSLLALFVPRRRPADPFSLPTVHRTPKDALARAHAHLRPILLTPRSIARSPAYYTHRAQSTRSRSTIFPEHAAAVQASDLQRTSPKLDSNDPELAAVSVTGDHAGPPGMSTTSFREGTPDTSLSVLPLTPPDRCYLVPMPSVTNCPYVEPWPANAALDRGKPRPQGSPLKVSINMDPAFPGPIGSPPPGRWSPVQIWTSTPCKNAPSVPDPALSLFDHHTLTQSTVDPSPPLEDISHALISRSRSSIRPYSDTSDSSPSRDASPAAVSLQQPDRVYERDRAHTRLARFKNQPYPQFHYPDAYTCAWRRHGPRVPGKRNANANASRAYPRSRSHLDLRVNEWYDAVAYESFPVSALSPPLCDSATEDEDEDELPLCRLRERLARRSAAVGATIGLGVPLGASLGTRETAAPTAPFVSPRIRRMSEGCLLAISESTPTRIGMGARLSLTPDAEWDACGTRDWLDALALQFSSTQKDAPESAAALPPVTDAVAGPDCA